MSVENNQLNSTLWRNETEPGSWPNAERLCLSVLFHFFACFTRSQHGNLPTPPLIPVLLGLLSLRALFLRSSSSPISATRTSLLLGLAC
jgi:hypothetical protein